MPAVPKAWQKSVPATDFSVFVPLHYEKKYSYPLIVWLHGDGAECQQLQTVMPEISARNYVGVAPGVMRSTGGEQAWAQTESNIDAVEASVMSAINSALMRFNIATDRIYLAGLESGGTMAMQIALGRPDIFAGVISINGPLSQQYTPMSDWRRCRQLPVLISQQRNSKSLPEERLCDQLRLLHVAGFEVTVRQYPESDTAGDKVVFSDIDRWVMDAIDSSIVDPS